MAYDARVEIPLATAQAITTTGDKTTFRYGYGEVSIYACAIVVTTLVTEIAAVTIARRPTVGSDTGRVTIATINIPASTAVGKVIYKELVNTLIRPGEELVTAVTDLSAAGAVDIKAWGELRYAQPLNNTAMAATT